MPHADFDLAASAREEMIHEGFHPDFSPAVAQQLAALQSLGVPTLNGDIEDLRSLLWSSIDNDTSRDLDQIEVAERVNEGIRVRIGIADVDSDVDRGSPIDQHAADQTTTVYTAVRNFPMLPEQLSTGLTSLNQGQDRLAVVIEFVVRPDGSIASSAVSRAMVRNRAHLTYEGIGPWLEGGGSGPPAEVAAQLKLQDEAASALRAKRHELGALEFDRAELQAAVSDGHVHSLAAARRNRASALIEDFMVAANEVMARTLSDAGVSSIRRVVRSPERWPRIVDIARQYGASLPDQPDSGALAAFLRDRQNADPVHYPDLSLSIIKLLGPGEYVLVRPGETGAGHFGLAAHDYTHSTAPNRRFADLVTQRLIKAVFARQAGPYSDDELAAFARNCTLREDAARKVERTMAKRVAAVALQDRIGASFEAVVTGVTAKGVFVRVTNPPVEGMLVRGERGVDVGDQIRVTLEATDPRRGYIDFARS
ncbi:MAG TPA: RNB domain-containing ribonuclease [Bryobacteraceae bacterium]|nr:RNB domain-containing ribonuclease [Bryobacteraceae bacterium]